MSLLQKLATYRISRYFKLGFLIWDIALLNAAIIASFLLRFQSLARLEWKEVRTIVLLSNLLWIIILLHKDDYRIIRVERIESILIRLIKHLMIHIAVIAVIITVLKFGDISRLRMVYFYCIFFVFLCISRLIFMKILKYIRFKGYNYKSVVIIGANDAGANIHRILSKDLTYGYRIVGFFDDDVDSISSIPISFLGGCDAVEDFISAHRVDEMYIALHIDNIETINQLTALCERYMVRVKFIPDFQQYTGSRKVEITFYENTPVLILRKEPLEGTINLLLKKTFDLIFSFLVIALIFPWLFPILAVLIKLDSTGPVFFKQYRSGRENKPFLCLKFRTMKSNKYADKVQATEGDLRVTKIGAFMRRTNLDELPQFLNVLWGNMSVVGPRPHMLMQTDQYSALIANYLVRHYAKPGITGWAQVNGLRGETKKLMEMKDRVDCDIWYIENWSVLLDFKIIFRTVLNVINGEKKAY